MYQIDEQTYGAGFVESVCRRRGRIVERWPIDTEEQIDFVKRHGSAFKGVYHRVRDLAEKAIYIDEGFREFDEEREALLVELSELPLKARLRAGLQIIFRRVKCY